MSLNINNIVQVNASITTSGLSSRNFGIGLYVTTDTTLNPSDPLQIFASIDDVADVFGSSGIVYSEAQLWFAQDPAPQDLMIGRYVNTDTSSSLTSGSSLPDLLSLITISDGSLTILATDVTGIDLTSAGSYSDIALILASAMSSVTGFTITGVYNATTGELIFTNSATGILSLLTYASATGSGTDLSSLLLLTETTATELRQGQELETITQALEKFQSINNIFYFITLGSELKDTSDVTETAVFVVAQANTNAYMFFAESSDPATLITDDSASVFAQLFSQQSDRVVGDYTMPASENTNTALFTNGLGLSSSARLSSINFSGTNTIINPKFRDRPLVAPANSLTTSQSQELDRKRINRFVPINAGASSSTLENVYNAGYCFKNSIWQDIRLGVDWLVNAIQVEVTNLLVDDPTLSQSVDGQNLVKSTITDVLKQGVENGLIAPGTLSKSLIANVIAQTGNSSFNGFLSSGYLVAYDSLATQSEEDRDARKLPPYYVWAKGSGKVNFVAINLVFDQ